MENTDFSQKLPQLLLKLKPFLLSIGLGSTGLLLIGYGLIASLFPQSASNDIFFHTQEVSDIPVKSIAEEIVIDVSGGVVKPGVYRVENGSRITDVIQKAGGFSDDADQQKIQHSLNLAAKVADGMKVYVPRIGESAEQTSGANSSLVTSGAGAVAGVSTNGVISLNSASAQELDSLPGVGKVTAEKIISSRPYSSIDELLSKKIVGKATFEKIKEKISL